MGRALVIGCGGTLGFAWTAAVLSELEAQGWDPRTADVLVGTSAGAELVALLGSGVAAAHIHDGSHRLVAAHLSSPRAPGRFPGLPRPALPGLGMAKAALTGRVDLMAGVAGLLPRGGGNAQWLVDLGDTLADPTTGWAPHPDILLAAADTLTRERIPFGRADAPKAPLGRAIAASWAIPGWFPPVRIGDRDYLDGGAVSPTSADLLLPRISRNGEAGGIDEVVIVAPMSSATGAPARGLNRIERLLRTPMTKRVDREVAMLQAAGARVRRIEPSQADLDVMGPNFMDGSRVEAVREQAARSAQHLVRTATNETTLETKR